MNYFLIALAIAGIVLTIWALVQPTTNEEDELEKQKAELKRQQERNQELQRHLK